MIEMMLGFFVAVSLVNSYLIWKLWKRPVSAVEHVEEKRAGSIDEGFENIMSFSVNGHDGFGGAQ